MEELCTKQPVGDGAWSETWLTLQRIPANTYETATESETVGEPKKADENENRPVPQVVGTQSLSTNTCNRQHVDIISQSSKMDHKSSARGHVALMKHPAQEPAGLGERFNHDIRAQ